MNPIDQVTRDFLAECLDDYVGLWSILRRIQQAFPDKTPSEYRRLILDLLGQLLSQGRVLVGDLTLEKGFQPWQASPQEALVRIEREWEELGHEPDLGDIAWFTSED